MQVLVTDARGWFQIATTPGDNESVRKGGQRVGAMVNARSRVFAKAVNLSIVYMLQVVCLA